MVSGAFIAVPAAVGRSLHDDKLLINGRRILEDLLAITNEIVALVRQNQGGHRDRPNRADRRVIGRAPIEVIKRMVRADCISS